MYNLDPEGLNPYPKEKPTWAMVKHATSTLSRIDLRPERNVSEQWRTERPQEAGRPTPRRPLGPKFQHLRKIPEELTSMRD